MRFSVDEVLQVRDIRILADKVVENDQFFHVVPRGDRIERAKDASAIRKILQPLGWIMTWHKKDQVWVIQK